MILDEATSPHRINHKIYKYKYFKTVESLKHLYTTFILDYLHKVYWPVVAHKRVTVSATGSLRKRDKNCVGFRH